MSYGVECIIVNEVKIKYYFENVSQREISQIAQKFGKLRDLKYLSSFFSYECFLISKKWPHGGSSQSVA